MDTKFTRLAICICIYLVFLTNGAFGNGEQRNRNKTYVITTILSEPYVMYKNRNLGNSTQGNDTTLDGMFIELLEKIAGDSEVGFKYRIQLVKDGRYGFESPVKGWTGMIGELIDGKADIAMADLTIRSTRASVITFSQPFLDAGLRILYKKPALWVKMESLFVLFAPFSVGVWIVLIIVFVIASILLCLIGRFSPLERDEKTGRPPAAFSVDKCFLYTFKALTWQGMGVMPKSFSGRVLSATWWSVCLIVIACYIANLTAFFLTKEPPIRVTPFLTFEELSRQTTVQYGVVANGSTYHHFKHSERDMEKRMWMFMNNSKPSVFTKNYQEGMERVQKSSNYAFIAESTFAEYQANRHCDLMVLGQPLTDHEYGFACSKANTDLCRDIDYAILKLKEMDVLHQLKRKWFSGPCSSQQKAEFLFEGNLFFDSATKSDIRMETAVSLGRMLSVWVIFLIGSFLSFVVLGFELCLRGKKGKKATRLDTPDDQQKIEEFYDE